MKRRRFLKGTVAAAVLAAANLSGGCDAFRVPPKQKELEVKNLKDFLTSPKSFSFNRTNLGSCLYDIRYENTATNGRAMGIGENLFLTTYSLVDEDVKNLLLAHQSTGNKALGYEGFSIVHFDKETDLALLKGVRGKIKDEKTKLHFNSKMPSLEDKVSTFVLLKGTPKKERVECKVDGQNIYEEGQLYVVDFGAFILPANSLLMETQGKVLVPDEDYSNRFIEELNLSDTEYFTTLLCSDTGIGQPVFTVTENGGYAFSGIIRRIVETGRNVVGIRKKYNPHPLGSEKVDQTNSIVIKPDVVKRFLEEAIKTYKK